MRRLRIRRRRALAVLLVPAAAITIGPTTSTAATEREAAIDPAKQTVRYGARVKLRGEFPGAPDAPVAIEYRAAGKDRYRGVATARTGADGRWSKRVKPRGTGKWRARLGEAPAPTETGGQTPLAAPVALDRASDAKRVRVRSKTRVRAKNHAVKGERVRVGGRVRPGGRRKVVVRVGGKRVRTRTNRRGRFQATWRAGSTGTRRISAKARRNDRATGSRDRGGRVTVYRRASASWYGPGLYGNRTACGQTLTPGIVGVAHKSMPCGTKLKLRNRGRTVTARVIDRGPYVHGREFDLTSATRNKLGFGSTGTILSSK